MTDPVYYPSSAFDAWAAAVRQRESTDDYGNNKNPPYYGAYQMGPSAMQDAGFIYNDKDSLNDPSNWTLLANGYGINSVGTFLSSTAGQNFAFENWIEKNWNYLQGDMGYVGQTIDNVTITVSGILAGAQLAGSPHVKSFFNSDGAYNPSDNNHKTISDYMQEFGGSNFAFSTQATAFSPAFDTVAPITLNPDGTYSVSLNADWYALHPADTQRVTISGAQSIALGPDGTYTLTDQYGNQYTLAPQFGLSPYYQLTSATGLVNIAVGPAAVQAFQLGPNLAFNMGSSASGFVDISTGAGSLTDASGVFDTFSQPSDLVIDPNQISVGPTNSGAGTQYNLSPTGTLVIVTTGYLGLPDTTTFASVSADAAATEAAINSTISFDTPSGPAINSLITNISVSDLGTLPQGQLPFTTDPTGSVLYGILLGGTYSDFQVIDPTVNDNGLFRNSPAGILSGGWRPGNQNLLDPSQNLTQLIGGETAASAATGGFESNITVPAAFTDYSGQSNSYLNIDPLVLDLTGQGISLSNWIDNSVYFQSNVSFNPTTGQAVSDGKLHHTSWVNPGDGILVLPVSGAVPDITDTLSEYFRGGQYNATTGQYTPWKDGLAALASLATPGATVFSTATSLIDPATGQSYWSELQVWQDTNQNGTADPGELQSLSALGITSISLVGSGNSGESIAGSAVVNRTSYTTSAGTVGEVAAIDLSTDTTGDTFTTTGSGVTITSTPEGGATPTTSFVDRSASAQSYTLSGGTGNTVFLVNAKTVVHAGAGFNIAEAQDNLQESFREVRIHDRWRRCFAKVVFAFAIGVSGPLHAAPHSTFASAGSNAISSCVAHLLTIGNAVMVKEWTPPPLPPSVRETIGSYFRFKMSEYETVQGWTQHKNPNLTQTIIVWYRDKKSVRPSLEDHPTDVWVIMIRDREGVAVKAFVQANGVAFSKESRAGVSGLYFCGWLPPAVGPQWIWNGNRWVVSNRAEQK